MVDCIEVVDTTDATSESDLASIVDDEVTCCCLGETENRALLLCDECVDDEEEGMCGVFIASALQHAVDVDAFGSCVLATSPLDDEVTPARSTSIVS